MPAPSTPSAPAPPAAQSGGADGGGPAFSPLYRQIKGLLTRSLQAGEWGPGEAIPSEMELAARYRVSQGTVRKAVDELATENLLVRRQGKGTFVATHAEERTQYRFLRVMPNEGASGGMQRRLLECRRLAQAWGRGFSVRNPPEKLSALAKLYGVGDLLFATAPSATAA